MRSGLRRLLRGGLAGALAGALVLGLGGRAVMRAIALRAGAATGFSLGGTLDVVAFGLLTGVAAGAAWGWLRPRVHLPPVARGAALGALVFALLVALPPPAARGAFAGFTGHAALVLGLFAAVFVAFGLAVEALLGRLDGGG
ncbi:MAG TPA: hypothetical protein VII13_12655 [Vicinamibacteria bacterium]|jgi:hypothetical protein